MACEAQQGHSFLSVVPLALLMALGWPGLLGSVPPDRVASSDTTATVTPPPLPEVEAMPRATLRLTPHVEIVEVPSPPEFLGPGEASYYNDALSGHPTASGEPYDPTALTAAHRTLPLGTRVRITNLRNGNTVDVRINDRGPFVAGRIIDLSRAAARHLGMVRRGIADIHLHLLPKP